MGREPRGEWSVAARCHLGVPMVIANHPRLSDGSPFPTLYWLTCPVLARRVSSIESTGWMSRLNEHMAEVPGLRERLAVAVASYRTTRDELEEIDDGGNPPGGGPVRVKCVHAHVAHQLAQGCNAVGALALADVGWPDCSEPCFRVVAP